MKSDSENKSVVCVCVLCICGMCMCGMYVCYACMCKGVCVRVVYVYVCGVCAYMYVCDCGIWAYMYVCGVCCMCIYVCLNTTCWSLVVWKSEDKSGVWSLLAVHVDRSGPQVCVSISPAEHLMTWT